MKTKKLTEVLERVEAWPADVQNELAEFALELDAGLKDGEYQPTPEELAGIDRGLRAAAEGRFANEQEVEAVFFLKFCAKVKVHQDGWSDLSAVARRAKAEAIPINCCSWVDGARETLNPSYELLDYFNARDLCLIAPFSRYTTPFGAEPKGRPGGRPFLWPLSTL